MNTTHYPIALPNLLFFITISIPLHSGAIEMNNRLPMEAQVKMYHGRPTIFVNHTPYAPMLYALTDQPGGRWSTDEIPQLNLQLFAQVGIKLYQVDIFLEHLWQEDDTFNLEAAKRQIRGILQACPEAGVFFRFHVNAPKWWIKQHPEEGVAYDQATALPDPIPANRQLIAHDAGLAERFSLASQKWLTSSTEKLERFCREFAKTEEGRHLIGIQVACGIYGEWHPWGFLHWEADFSEPMRAHFAEWSQKKYGGINQLKKAWQDPKVEFETITVPTTAEREKTSGIFRDPQLHQKVIDYYTCQHQLIANHVLHFCKTVKENWPRPIITGSFYGYFFSGFNRLAAGCHLELTPVLTSPYIDYLCGPQAYEPESYLTGQPYRSRSLITSMRLNGKLWLDEMDQEPKRMLPYGAKDVPSPKYEDVISENVAQLTRNVMFSHSKGMGLWFYDFGPAGFHTHPERRSFPEYCLTGYWDHPRYLASIKKLKEIFDEKLQQEYRSNADVLLVYDTQVQYHLMSVGKGDPVTAQIIDWMSLHLFYAGVVFDPIHLSDLDKIDVRQYKMVVFANTFLTDEKIKEIIQNRIAKENRHLLWIYAPAYSNGKVLSDQFVEEITGIELMKTTCDDTPSLEVLESIHAPKQTAAGSCAPLFAIKDPAATIYGHYSHDRSAAFGRKDFADHTSWFIGLPPTDYRLLKFILKSAGVHVYTDDQDIFYSGSSILTMHSKNGGKKSLQLKNGRVLSLDLPPSPITVLLDSETGEIFFQGR